MKRSAGENWRARGFSRHNTPSTTSTTTSTRAHTPATSFHTSKAKTRQRQRQRVAVVRRARKGKAGRGGTSVTSTGTLFHASLGSLGSGACSSRVTFSTAARPCMPRTHTHTICYRQIHHQTTRPNPEPRGELQLNERTFRSMMPFYNVNPFVSRDWGS